MALGAFVLLALAEGDGAGAREQAGQMAAALAAMGPEAVPEHQIMAHYNLAKFWSNQNEHDAALATGRPAMRCCAASSRSRARRMPPSSMLT